MKSLLQKVLEALLGMFRPFIKETVKKVMLEILEKARLRNETNYKIVLNALYPPIDVHLEELVKETKTDVDDVVVAGLKESFEESAAANGVILPDLDEGQPGD